ncbi:trypsin-like peptidase domain-containing protein [Acidipila rosea]|uniref:Serine protease Do n=1 Tax=Acidipila rosea TaxID=768535 RepID=A0A4V2PVA4_9BACT|nr:trypsin-like peptidase domain-containing protein [Acidipila rosea]TCK73581.1 serine protease Do [Acidipila rosea]
MKSLLERLRVRRLASTFTVLATLSAGILIGSVVAHGVKGQEKTVDSSDATPLKIPNPRDLSTTFTRIAKEVGPAVVNINSETLPKEHNRRGRMRQAPQQQGPDDNSPDDDQGPGQGNDQGGMQDFFNRFFGMGPQGPEQGGPDDGGGGGERESLGSGFIVDSRGYIITNNHVVDKADKIYVKLTTDPEGERGHPATVVGVDKDTDIAVIKINVDHPLPTVKMGNSDSAQVGDWVMAIGIPFNLSQTVTAGIVSAKNRTIDPTPAGQFQHFIQTDAAINPGNSGGPLINMAGEVIGVNTAIYTESGGYQGIGFAMPANTVISDYNDLIGPEHKVVRGSIGISFRPNLPPAVSRVYGFKNGVLISSVTPGQPADKAGLKTGDIITAIDGKTIKDGDELVNNISARKPGTSVSIGYLRNGKPMTTTVTIGDRTKVIEAGNVAGNQQGPGSGSGADASQSKLGITVRDLPQGAPADLHGVLVQTVKPGSFADSIQLPERGVIIAVNKQPVRNKADYNAIVSELKSGQDVVFEVVDPQHPHDGSNFFGGTLQ